MSIETASRLPPAAAGAAREPGNRHVAVDVLRLALAYGVAAIHLAPNTPAAEIIGLSFLLFAVPFFLMAGLYFFLGRLERAASVPGARELRFERLWLPYFTWTLVYAGLHAAKNLVLQRRSDFDVAGVLLYGGAAVQMYFLPLLLLLQCWAWSLDLLRRAPGRRWLGAVLLLLATGFAWGGRREHALGFDHVFLSGAAYLGGALLLRRYRNSRRFRLANTAFAALLAAALLSLVLFGDPHGLLRFGWGPAAGYAAFSLALAWPASRPLPAWTAFLLGTSYGIYLMHFAFIEALELAAPRLGWHLHPYDVASKLGVTIAVCAACTGAIVLVRRSRPARACLLGEGIQPDWLRLPPIPLPARNRSR